MPCAIPRENVRGTLVKLNDQWIVLHANVCYVVEERSSHLAHLPFVAQFFNSKKSRRVACYYWVPRDAATIVEHSAITTKSDLPAVTNENPPAKELCTMFVADAGKATSRAVSILAVKDGALVLVDDRVALGSILVIRTEVSMAEPKK